MSLQRVRDRISSRKHCRAVIERENRLLILDGPMRTLQHWRNGPEAEVGYGRLKSRKAAGGSYASARKCCGLDSLDMSCRFTGAVAWPGK